MSEHRQIPESSIVQEVRARAMQISERYGHDLRSYAKHLAEVERREAGRVVEQPRITSSEQRSKPAA